jgi:hypothetical protein
MEYANKYMHAFEPCKKISTNTIKDRFASENLPFVVMRMLLVLKPIGLLETDI